MDMKATSTCSTSLTSGRELDNARPRRTAAVGEAGRPARRARTCIMSGEASSAANRAERLVAGAVDAGGAAHARVDADLAATDATRDADEAGAGGGLDQAERAVLVALADGQSVSDIATSLRMPEEMLGIHMANVLAKLHRQHAARSARGRSRVGGLRPTENG